MIVCAAIAPAPVLALAIVFSALLVAMVAAGAAGRLIIQKRAARRGRASGETAADNGENAPENVGAAATSGETAPENGETAADNAENATGNVGTAYVRASGKTTFDGAAAELPPDQAERLQKLLSHALSAEGANRKDVGAKLKVRLRTRPLVTLSIRKGAIVATFKAVTEDMDEYRRKSGIVVPDVVVRVRDDESLSAAMKMTDNTAAGYERIKEAARRRRLEERREKRRAQASGGRDGADKN